MMNQQQRKEWQVQHGLSEADYCIVSTDEMKSIRETVQRATGEKFQWRQVGALLSCRTPKDAQETLLGYLQSYKKQAVERDAYRQALQRIRDELHPSPSSGFIDSLLSEQPQQ